MIDFPSNPATGQVFNSITGSVYTWDGVAWNLGNVPMKTADRRNRIVNPAMAISQENGNNNSVTAANGSFYPADQWFYGWNLAGTVNARRTRPADSGSDIAQASIVSATPTPATDAYLYLCQPIEGHQIKDLLWGTAAAKAAVCRFNFYSDVGGRFSLSIRNGNADRSYLATFAAVAGKWQVFSFPIPGDTSGVWSFDNQLAINVGIGLATGSSLGGGVAGWQSGNKLQMAGDTNGAAVAGKSFYVTDFGFYADPDKTGIAPPFEVPDVATEMEKCKRYWEKGTLSMTCFSAVNGFGYFTQFSTSKRVVPTMTANFSYANCASGALYADTESLNASAVCSAQAQASFSAVFVANARM